MTLLEKIMSILFEVRTLLFGGGFPLSPFFLFNVFLNLPPPPPHLSFSQRYGEVSRNIGCLGEDSKTALRMLFIIDLIVN